MAGFKPQRGKFTPKQKQKKVKNKTCFKPQRGKFTLHNKVKAGGA